MKTKSSNSREDSKKIRPAMNHEKMKQIAKLQGRKSSDGRELSYEDEIENESVDELKKRNKNITGKDDQKDIKKESDVRSERESEKHSDANGEERGKDEEEEKEFEERKSSWHRSYKGDAEIVI